MNPNKRLLSLDVLRGITVAGMILVNNTGKCGYNFAAFAHAKWDGFSPADLVFPMFMFLMGISTYWQKLLVGVVLIAAGLVDNIRRRKILK